MDQAIVYQVINFDREEMFFGTTDIHLDKEIEKLARDPKGPTSGWKKGDLVHWRPLTELIEEAVAKQLHKEFEGKTPPNQYKVIPTFREE